MKRFPKRESILNLPRDQSSLLLALRTRTYRGIRSDFGDLFPSKECPLPGCSALDSLPHTLACRVLQGSVTEPSSVKYGDVFSPDLTVQREAVARFSLILEARDTILTSG